MLITVGDSITKGHCAHDENSFGWADHIDNTLKAKGDANYRDVNDVTNLAMSGRTIDDLLPTVAGHIGLLRNAKIHQGSIMLLAMLGGPDSMTVLDKKNGDHKFTPFEGFKSSMRQFAAIFPSKHLRAYVGFVSNTPTLRSTTFTRWGVDYQIDSSEWERYQEPIRSLAEEMNAPYIDVYTPLANALEQGNDVLTPDRVHPNALGHLLIAQTVQPVVDSYLSLSANRKPKNTPLHDTETQLQKFRQRWPNIGAMIGLPEITVQTEAA